MFFFSSKDDSSSFVRLYDILSLCTTNRKEECTIMINDKLLINPNILDNHNEHIRQLCLLLISLWAHGKYISYWNWYHAVEYTEDNRDFHNLVFSIVLQEKFKSKFASIFSIETYRLNFYQQSIVSDSIHTVLYWWSYVCNKDHRYNVISDDEFWRWAIRFQPFVYLHVVLIQLLAFFLRFHPMLVQLNP